MTSLGGPTLKKSINQCLKQVLFEPYSRVVDVFALICHLLDLDLPNAVDSELSRLAHLLRVSIGTNENTTLAKVEDYLSFLLTPENLPISSKNCCIFIRH